MSSVTTTNGFIFSDYFAFATPKGTHKLRRIVQQYSGRALFATRLGAEDQVLAHLIFKATIPVRVFTYSGWAPDNVLLQSVDLFQRSIEVSTQQSRRAAAIFAQNHPEAAAQRATRPATASIEQLLAGHHVLISSQRKSELAQYKTNPVPMEWDETNQRAIFYPLFYWTNAEVEQYLTKHQLIHNPAFPVWNGHAATVQPTWWQRALAYVKNKLRSGAAAVQESSFNETQAAFV